MIDWLAVYVDFEWKPNISETACQKMHLKTIAVNGLIDILVNCDSDCDLSTIFFWTEKKQL